MSDTPNARQGAYKPTYKLQRTENFAKAYNQAKGGNFSAAGATLTNSRGVVVRPYGMDFTNPSTFRRNQGVIRHFLNADIEQYRRIGGRVRNVI